MQTLAQNWPELLEREKNPTEVNENCKCNTPLRIHLLTFRCLNKDLGAVLQDPVFKMLFCLVYLVERRRVL